MWGKQELAMLPETRHIERPIGRRPRGKCPENAAAGTNRTITALAGHRLLLVCTVKRNSQRPVKNARVYTGCKPHLYQFFSALFFW